MTTHAALLRAVNLAGRNTVKMADLRELATGLGLANVRTLLQSGNLIFESRGRTPARLERLLQGAARDHLALATEVFVRSGKELAAIVAGNPFPGEAKRDPARLLVLFLDRAPDRPRVAALEEAVVGREVIRTGSRHLYIVYPDGAGRSRLTNVVIERTLGARGTARNWNTVLKLAALTA